MSIVKKNGVAAILALAIILGFAFAFATPAKATTLRVVQTPTLHLYSGETIAATTMRITPYPKDLDGTKLTITDLGTLPTVTVDPKLSGIEEIESFTSITDNGDNTATLSGLSRSLTSKYPYTTAGTGRSHGVGATVVFGNNPQVYGRLWAPENQATSTNILYFTSTFMPQFDVDPGAAAYTAAPSTAFVDMAQLTRTAIAGATNATRAVQGLVQVAFRGQAASSTPFGSTGAFAILTSDIATSSPSLAMSTSSVVMTRLDSRIAPILLSTSTSDIYSMGNLFILASSTFMGTTVFNSTTTVNGILAVASSTPSASGFKFVLGGSAYFSGGLSLGVASTTGNGWAVFQGGASTTNMTISGKCVGCTNGYEINYAGGSLNAGSPSVVTVTASCTAGKVVIGGGATSSVNVSCGGDGLVQSSPSSNNGWTVSYTCGNGNPGTVGATAICVNP